MILEILPEKVAQVGGDIRNVRIQSGNKSRVEGQQIETSALDGEQGAHQLLAVVLGVEIGGELDGRRIDHVAADTIRQSH